MKTEFPTGLARVKVKTLFGSDRFSWVRSGPGRVTGLRCFPYPGAIGLAGLGRVTGLRCFSYPGAIGLAGLG
jgi:hypothetical protein